MTTDNQVVLFLDVALGFKGSGNGSLSSACALEISLLTAIVSSEDALKLHKQ